MAVVPRVIVPLLLVVLFALSGCDDGAEGAAANSEATEDAASAPEASTAPSEDEAGPDSSESTDPGESTDPTDDAVPEATRRPVSTKAFCEGIHPVLVAKDGSARGQAAMDLLSDGLPEEMETDAREGLQVLVDLSPYFDDTKELFRSYYALGAEDKRDVHALAGFVMTACGADLIADLMPTLPEDLVSDLPSDLASLLPS